MGRASCLGPDDPFLLLFTSRHDRDDQAGAAQPETPLDARSAGTRSVRLRMTHWSPRTPQHMYYVGLVSPALCSLFLGGRGLPGGWDPR